MMSFEPVYGRPLVSQRQRSAELNDHPRVLIVAHTMTFLTELAPFGDLVSEQTPADVTFYCPFEHWTSEKFAEECKRKSVTCLLPPLRASLAREGLLEAEGRVPSHRLHRLLTRLVAGLAARFGNVGASFLAEYASLKIAAEEIRLLLEALNPKLLVLGGDMASYDTSLYIKLAHERGVPTLIVPSTMSNGREQAEVYHGDLRYHVTGWVRGLIAAYFPKWVMRHKDVRLFRCPPGRILAMELAGLAPPQPWIFNSGAADAIAMESQAMIDYYADVGMKDARMILTGSLSDDALATRLTSANELRDRLCREYDFDPTRPLVLCAMVPDFLYLPGGRPECDFETYDELVAFWINCLNELNCNCIVALHPSVDADDMRHVERKNIRLGSRKTAEMVPACDVYVASISSTIRWAIACGKPVVNYDVYRYRYTDFSDVPGVLTTEEQAEFRSLLRRLIVDQDFHQAVVASQVTKSAYWGMLDGNAGVRMLALVESLSGIVSSKEGVFCGVDSQENG
jgi:hypothetical protein